MLKIDYLGHSEFLVHIQNSEGKIVKILSDSWLSDYAVGDLMGRNPCFSLDYASLPDIDAIFLSHAHMDHIDPYTLVPLYKNAKNSPAIFLPETLLYIKPLLAEYLDNPKIVVLKNKEPIIFNGIKILGYCFETGFISNEADVMSLFLSNAKEMLFTEVDMSPPDIDEVHNYIYSIFSEKDYETIVYLATRNELEGNLKLLDMKTSSERIAFASEYRENREEEIEYEYAKFDEEIVEYKDISSIKNFMKIFIGQGICYPVAQNRNFLKFSTMTLRENVEIERAIASDYGRKFPIDSFVAGKSYSIQNARIIKNEDIPYLLDLKMEQEKPDLHFSLVRKYSKGPLYNEKRDFDRQKELIISLLNNRFLPYRLTLVEDNLKDIILKKPSKSYVICVKYGLKNDYEEVYYGYDFSKARFELISLKNASPDEEYWANDLHDFSEGTQELYSSFLHTIDEDKFYRFWTSLGACFINTDFVYNKMKYHFERAKKGETARDFVETFYNNL